MAYPYYDYGLEDAPQATRDAERRAAETRQSPEVKQSAQDKLRTDPVTGKLVQSFMQGPAVQRMLAAQQAGGTGKLQTPGGFMNLPMMQMLAPYLSQRPQGGMSPLLAQMLPQLMAQQQAPQMGAGVGQQMGQQFQQPMQVQQAGAAPSGLAALIAQRFGQRHV